MGMFRLRSKRVGQPLLNDDGDLLPQTPTLAPEEDGGARGDGGLAAINVVSPGSGSLQSPPNAEVSVRVIPHACEADVKDPSRPPFCPHAHRASRITISSDITACWGCFLWPFSAGEARIPAATSPLPSSHRLPHTLVTRSPGKIVGAPLFFVFFSSVCGSASPSFLVNKHVRPLTYGVDNGDE